MKMKRNFSRGFIILILLLLSLMVWNLMLGTVSISFRELLEIMAGNSSDEMNTRVIWNIRFPRLVASVFLGGSLSLSGFLLQTFFSNPVAGPFVLGISSGAKLFVALVMILFLKAGIQLNSFSLVMAAFCGSMLSMTVVLLLSVKVRNMAVLIVCGILVGYICSAVTDFLVTFASDSNIVNLHNWSMGSFSGTTWKDVKVIILIVSVVTVFTFFMAKPIGAFQLGENYARNMGVNVKKLRIVLIVTSSLLSACVTAFAGPVSFVGIAVPHLIRSVTGTAKPLVLIPACFIGGAAVTVFCDGIARWVFAPVELSISTVTAFFLVPVVIWMMVRRENK